MHSRWWGCQNFLIFPSSQVLELVLLPSHLVKLSLPNILPPATKLGQGYIFTGVCDSVNRGSVWSWGVSGPGGCLVLGGVSAPGEVCSWGVWYREGVPGGNPPGWLLLWAVRILLECILVLDLFVFCSHFLIATSNSLNTVQ